MKRTFFHRLKTPLAVCLFLLLCITPSPGLAENFPEPNPPLLELWVAPTIKSQYSPATAIPTTEWTFHKTIDGAHPDGNEQQFMWLMNRARGNPIQEGIWLATMNDLDVATARSYFDVDLELLRAEFAAITVKPPAAFDVRLYNAAKSHSDYLISIDGSDHTGQFDRIGDEGFHYLTARGNVFAYCKTALYGHAGFNIDWGYGSDGSGMQDDRGHRKAVMSIDGSYSNVGIAAVPEASSSTAVGPLVVTGNYCSANPSYADHYNLFIVGTVWEDKDGDSFYDPGEGIGGVTVMPSQGNYFAVTAKSGGYAIPLITGGTYEVTFSGPGVPSGTVRSVTVGGESVLLELLVEPTVDSDHDGVPDAQDAFPTDPTEWLDTDNDGTGNHADTDDDGDGMPDEWEVKYGLNPLLDDALEDKDGDGYSNLQEFKAGTLPTDRRSRPPRAMPWLPLLLSD
jgi:Bacterial TSP3 repeat